MDKPTRNLKPHHLTDLHDDYGEAWKYIEHLEVERDRACDRARTAAQTLIAKIGAPGPEWVEETAARAVDRITELEAMLGAGNLCAFQMVLKQGSESDMQMRSRETSYTKMSATRDGEEFHFYNTLPVLIADEGGLSVWRFYRKAGH